MFGADVITAVVGSIVYDGLKRPFKGIASLQARREGINHALVEGGDQGDASRRNAAVSDVIRVLGNDHDAFNERVGGFLVEVERSAIPDALKQFALCGQDAQAAFPAFDLIYRSHLPLPFESEKLFAAISSAITLRIEQETGNKPLLEATKAQRADLASRIDALASCLSNLNDLNSTIPAELVREIRVRVAKGIEGANKQLNVETTQGTKRIAINKLVIPARLARLRPDGKFPNPHRESTGEEPAGTIGYLPFRRSFDKVVILGDPGGGKSTLTQLLCHGLASQISLEASNPNHPTFDSRDLRLPFRIILRSLERRQQKNPAYSVFDYIQDDLRVYCDNDGELARRFLARTLALGQAVLLFDGLDEILDVNARRSMTAFIEQFSDAHATCPVLVTSRIVGYTDAPLSDEYSIFTLARFNAEEINKFSQLLIRAVAGKKVSEAAQMAAQFLHQSGAVAPDLRENPLLLGLMVYIFVIRGDVPNNRPEIYKECSLLMFEKWDQRRDIIFEFPQDFDLLDLFGHLAVRIFGNAETEDGVSEEWLRKEIRAFFDGWYEDKARAIAASRVLVSFITGRAWVMCEIGPGVFKFTHRTFLEYFFARRIEEEAGSVAALVAGVLIGKIESAQWDVVSHLALQIATFRSAPKSQQAAETLLSVGRETKPGPKEEINFLTFTSRSLEYLSLPEGRLKEISGYIFARIVHIGSNYRYNAVEVIHDLLTSTSRRGDLVAAELVRLARPIVDGPSCPQRAFVMYLMGTEHAGYRAGRANQDRNELTTIWRCFRKLRDSSRQAQFNRALQGIDEAKTYVYVYGRDLLHLYKRYRLTLVITPPSSLIPHWLADLPLLILTEAVRVHSDAGFPAFATFSETRDQLAELTGLMAQDLYVAFKSESLPVSIPEAVFTRDHGLIYESLHQARSALGRGKPKGRNGEVVSNAVLCYVIWNYWGERIDPQRRSSGFRRDSAFRMLPELIDFAREFGTPLTSEYLTEVSAMAQEKARPVRLAPR